MWQTFIGGLSIPNTPSDLRQPDPIDLCKTGRRAGVKSRVYTGVTNDANVFTDSSLRINLAGAVMRGFLHRPISSFHAEAEVKVERI